MIPDTDHPLRYALVNELHARPFPSLEVPGHAVFLAIKEPVTAHARDRDRDRAHLLALLDRYGTAHPQPEATHFAAPIGRYDLKWESHTEFVTYSAFGRGNAARPFDPAVAEVFPRDWLEAAPGKRLCAVVIRIEEMPQDESLMLAKLDEWFVPESLTAARVVDGAALVAGDFRIDAGGLMRFAVFVKPGTGPRRVGRIVQRLTEVETYRAMSMLGLMRARQLTTRLNAIDPQLSDLVAGLDASDRPAEGALHELLAISAELETLAVQFSFRFGATFAYEAIVHQRVAAMREDRVAGRQTFAEFMSRRYDPAMRTVKSAEERLKSLAERAARAAELIRTRVDVERSAQNQKLLESMNQRADLQLRLQRTVEGLSVVAISYYAVSLAAYAAYPLMKALEIGKETGTALLVPPVILAVWATLKRIQKKMH